MLELGGIAAWIESGNEELLELRTEVKGETQIGFVESQHDAPFWFA